ncbi:MAG: polysaccharide biosynthesis/export family protein [Verrucomicrobiota bacterium]
MKLFVYGLFACAWLVAGVLLTGCGSASQGHLLIAAPPKGADVARFHVGDIVMVSFSGAPENIQDHVESIKEDGAITLPLVGAVAAVGKTAGELQNEIQTNYVPKYYVRLTVTVKSGDRIYFVGGEVKGGGRQLYVDGITVTKAIQTAGGLTDFANHGKVWLTRSSKNQRIRVNYDDALKNPAKDPPVYPDDQINVEKRIF